MDLLDDTTGSNAHDYTVSEISGAVKRVIEGEFGRVRVRGEGAGEGAGRVERDMAQRLQGFRPRHPKAMVVPCVAPRKHA